MTDVRSNNGHNDNGENLRRAFAFTNVVLRHRWLVIALPLLAGTLSVLSSVRHARTFTSKATFMTQGATRPTTTNVLAAQFGINLGNSGDATLSPDFYADLLVSRPILERIVRTTYSIPSGDSVVARTLVQLHGGED